MSFPKIVDDFKSVIVFLNEVYAIMGLDNDESLSIAAAKIRRLVTFRDLVVDSICEEIDDEELNKRIKEHTTERVWKK